MANIKSINGNPIVVDTYGIEDGAVTTDKIDDDAVIGDKIHDLAVRTTKLANNAVTSEKIAPNTITYADISVTGTDRIHQDNINDNAVNTRVIADYAVTVDKAALNLLDIGAFENDFDSVQTMPLSKGTYERAGVSVRSIGHGYVRIYGTATGPIRVRLNDTIAGSNGIADVLQNAHLMDAGWYSCQVRLVSGTYTCSSGGDMTGIWFATYDNDTYSYTKVNAVTYGWNYDMPQMAAWKHRHLADIVLMVKPDDILDCVIRIDVHEVSEEERALQKSLVNGMAWGVDGYRENDGRTSSYWVFGTTTTTGESDGLNGNNTRLAMEMPVKFGVPCMVAVKSNDCRIMVQEYTDPSDLRRSTAYLTWSNATAEREIPANKLVRIVLAKQDNTAISEADRIHLLESAVIRLKVESQNDLISRNPEFVSNLSAVRRKAVEGAIPQDDKPSNFHKTIIAHITDTHGDATRWNNFVDVCEFFEPDVVVHDGDIVKADMRDDRSYFTENLPSVPTVVAMGNHDVGSLRPIGSGGIKTDEVVLDWIQPINEKYGWNHSHPYYYYDTDKIRVIALYIYDYDADVDGIFVDRVGIYYTQAQIDWFISALQGALANGLSVIVTAHEPDEFMPYEDGFSKFNSTRNYSSHHSKRWQGNPICDIIEAFINGESISSTYVQANSSAPEAPSISVNANFSLNGDFVCWLTGHRHGDYLGWLPDYSQLQISEACGHVGISSPYSSMGYNDLGRIIGTKTEDCFNFYAIDTEQKTIGIVRFGADAVYDLSKRDAMILSYVKEQ